jgi:hypothetical protein
MLRVRNSSWCFSNGEAASKLRRALHLCETVAAIVFVRPHTSAAPWMKSTDRRWELELAAPSVQTKAAWIQSRELTAVGDLARRDGRSGASASAVNLSSTTTPRRSSIHGSCRAQQRYSILSLSGATHNSISTGDIVAALLSSEY